MATIDPNSPSLTPIDPGSAQPANIDAKGTTNTGAISRRGDTLEVKQPSFDQDFVSKAINGSEPQLAVMPDRAKAATAKFAGNLFLAANLTSILNELRGKILEMHKEAGFQEKMMGANTIKDVVDEAKILGDLKKEIAYKEAMMHIVQAAVAASSAVVSAAGLGSMLKGGSADAARMGTEAFNSLFKAVEHTAVALITLDKGNLEAEVVTVEASMKLLQQRLDDAREAARGQSDAVNEMLRAFEKMISDIKAAVTGFISVR